MYSVFAENEKCTRRDIIRDTQLVIETWIQYSLLAFLYRYKKKKKKII